ncbi:MAG: hypothetical protein XD78_0354 [Desulfotomaculum sp. 46_296]|nr:MAG: hypothetical protein XD78_0354 [Desulfotomaculum sp. 46_296]HAU31651.1 hypothetical protein [Desulfotomaculum sp.]
MEILKYYWQRFCRLFVEKRPAERLFTILDSVDESRRSWQAALKEFNLAEKDFIDYSSYKIIASQKRYIYLLRQAQNLGATSWPANELKPLASSLPVTNDN